jgi:uncharacterized membrane protein YciS (DUF1049 family)
MEKLARIILYFFLMLIFIASIAFSLVNKTAVPLNFGLFVLAPQPVSAWVIAAFCLGALFGLVSGAGLLQSRLKIRRLNKELLKREAQTGTLKNIEQKTTTHRRSG